MFNIVILKKNLLSSYKIAFLGLMGIYLVGCTTKTKVLPPIKIIQPPPEVVVDSLCTSQRPIISSEQDLTQGPQDGGIFNQQMFMYYDSKKSEYWLAFYVGDMSTKEKIETKTLGFISQNDNGQHKTVSSCGFKTFTFNEFASQQSHTMMAFSLVLDKSGSIDNTQFAEMQKTTMNFVEGLEFPFRGQLISFSDSLQSNDFTDNKNQLLSQINDTQNSDGGTALYDAINTAIDNLISQNEIFKFLVVMTDGQDNRSNFFSNKTHEKRAQQLSQRLEQEGIPIFMLGWGDINKPILDQLGEFGYTEFTDEFPEIKQFFVTIGKRLKYVYLFRISERYIQDGRAIKAINLVTYQSDTGEIQDNLFSFRRKTILE